MSPSCIRACLYFIVCVIVKRSVLRIDDLKTRTELVESFIIAAEVLSIIMQLDGT